MSKVAFTVTFADGTSKAYSRDFPEGELMAQLAEFVATRPYVRKPVSITHDGHLHTLKPAAKAKPPKAPKAPVAPTCGKCDFVPDCKAIGQVTPTDTCAERLPVVALEREIAALQAKLDALLPVKPAPAPAPKHAPITQTRAERKASRAAKKAADTKAPKLSAHERRMAESPVYAATYTRDLPVHGHVTSTMRAYKALVAEFEQTAAKTTRKARKAA